MANINLLPWRAKERERRNREFVMQMLIVGLLSMLLAFLGWTYFNSQLEGQREANEIVKQANTALDRNLKEIDELEKTRKNIVSRMEVIQKLQGTRPVPVHLFDSLVRTLPNSMFLTEVSLKGKTLHLKGRADSPNTISTLLRNLDATRWLEGSAVQSIKTGQESMVNPAPAVRAENGTLSPPAKSEAPEESYISFELTSELADVNLAEDPATNTAENLNENSISNSSDAAAPASEVDKKTVANKDGSGEKS